MFSPHLKILYLWRQMFWLKVGISLVLCPHCYTPGCSPSLIHHLLYSEPSYIYMEMTLKHIHFSWVDRSKEPRLPCSWFLQHSINVFFMIVTYTMFMLVFVVIKNNLYIYLLLPVWTEWVCYLYVIVAFTRLQHLLLKSYSTRENSLNRAQCCFLFKSSIFI